MEEKNNFLGHLLAIISITIWGTTFISTKILLETFSPVEIMFVRLSLAFIALSIVHPKKLELQKKSHEIYFALAGLTGVTLYFLFENIALTYTFASNVGIIVSISPFFTALLAQKFLTKEKLKLQFIIGFFVALAGIFLVSFNGNISLKANPLGDILAIGAAFCWAIYSIIIKKISEFKYNTIRSTQKIFFYGIIFMIPALFIFGFNIKISELIKPVNLFNLIYLGLGASALCFSIWNKAVDILGAVKTTVYVYMVPVVTIITSIIVLNEQITIYTISGIVLTLLGLIISQKKATKKI